MAYGLGDSPGSLWIAGYFVKAFCDWCFPDRFSFSGKAKASAEVEAHRFCFSLAVPLKSSNSAKKTGTRSFLQLNSGELLSAGNPNLGRLTLHLDRTSPAP